MNDHLPQEELAPEVVAGDPLLQRFADLITKPGRLMENVGRKTHLWLPYLVVFVVMSGFMWLVAPIMNPEQIEMSRDSKLMQMVPEEVRQEQYEQALNPSPGRGPSRLLRPGFSW